MTSRCQRPWTCHHGFPPENEQTRRPSLVRCLHHIYHCHLGCLLLSRATSPHRRLPPENEQTRHPSLVCHLHHVLTLSPWSSPSISYHVTSPPPAARERADTMIEDGRVFRARVPPSMPGAGGFTKSATSSIYTYAMYPLFSFLDTNDFVHLQICFSSLFPAYPPPLTYILNRGRQPHPPPLSSTFGTGDDPVLYTVRIYVVALLQRHVREG